MSAKINMNKLFDDTVYIDKSVVTPYDKAKWEAMFQSYCDSDEIRKESDDNGLNSCGYYYACDYCDGSDRPCACAKATIEYLEGKNIKIDYKNTTKEYLDRVLRYGDEF